MSAQKTQDQYGYVIMGWGGKKLSIGDVLPAYRDDWGRSEIIECPIVVVGFATVAEWKEQAAGDPRCDWGLAATYAQILKVRAE